MSEEINFTEWAYRESLGYIREALKMLRAMTKNEKKVENRIFAVNAFSRLMETALLLEDALESSQKPEKNPPGGRMLLDG